MTTRQDIVNNNYEAFQKILPSILQEKEGKHALLANGEVVDYFDTARDAQLAGEKLFPNGEWSVQEVTNTPINLGFWSYA